MEASTCRSIVQNNRHANGLAVIISNDYKSNKKLQTLSGTVEDGKNMKHTFEVLNLAVIHKHNLTLSATMELIQSIVSIIHYPPSYKSIVFIFSGHGNTDHCLYTNDPDTTTIHIEDVLSMFYPSQAPSLGNIPKLFFIDACRGDAVNPGVMVSRGGKSVGQMVPAEGNILVAYSTLSKRMSYEEQGKGGVWMSRLAEKLREEDASVGDILTNVNEEMMELYQDESSYPMQQPEYISRLNRCVFFLREARQVQARLSTKSQVGAKRSPGAVCKPKQLPKTDSPIVMCSWPPPGRKQTAAAKKTPTAKKSSSAPKKPATSRGTTTNSKLKSLPTTTTTTSTVYFSTGFAKERLEKYCEKNRKAKPIFKSEKVTGSRKFIGKAYIQQTCGWTSGEPKNTKAEAEEDAAAKLISKLML